MWVELAIVLAVSWASYWVGRFRGLRDADRALGPIRDQMAAMAADDKRHLDFERRIEERRDNIRA